jgi:hypothetical protein
MLRERERALDVAHGRVDPGEVRAGGDARVGEPAELEAPLHRAPIAPTSQVELVRQIGARTTGPTIIDTRTSRGLRASDRALGIAGEETHRRGEVPAQHRPVVRLLPGPASWRRREAWQMPVPMYARLTSLSVKVSCPRR